MPNEKKPCACGSGDMQDDCCGGDDGKLCSCGSGEAAKDCCGEDEVGVKEDEA